jgi:ABC-type spermidine/putrescine transport system, permease component I
MWVNFLVRTLSLQSIFKFLHIELGMGTLIIGLVYMFLPYMILPLNTTLSGIDKSYIEAAQDLGADNMTVLIKTIFPLSLPGIISGITMVFIPTISTFAISGFLSGSATIQLFGDSINSKFTYQLYGIGSVMSLVMLLMVLLSNFVMNRFSTDNSAEVKNVW